MVNDDQLNNLFMVSACTHPKNQNEVRMDVYGVYEDKNQSMQVWMNSKNKQRNKKENI